MRAYRMLKVALLLVLLIVVLNLTAIMLRSRLENRYRGVEA